MWHQSAIFENSWPLFCQIRIIFTHLKLWIASARHNFKWVKIQIELFGGKELSQNFVYTLFISTHTEINECLSSPCVNDATCTDNVNSYTCTCVDGYTGTNCETGMLNLHLSVYISIINWLVYIPHGYIFFTGLLYLSLKWAIYWIYSYS